ncbi:MAG: hypothetical protein AAGC86_00690 [Pseudomonadota bacterium]
MTLLHLTSLIVPSHLRCRCIMARDTMCVGKALKLEVPDRVMGPRFVGSEVDVAT